MGNPLIGKNITAVFLASDGAAIWFDIDGGNEQILVRADGDCCSHTWIEHVDGAEQLIGVVASVEDVPMPNLGSPEEYDVIAYYGCKITTDKGYATVDYRNQSNGYYGGNLSWPGEHFYGGVFQQNVIKGEWKQIA